MGKGVPHVAVRGGTGGLQEEDCGMAPRQFDCLLTMLLVSERQGLCKGTFYCMLLTEYLRIVCAGRKQTPSLLGEYGEPPPNVC